MDSALEDTGAYGAVMVAIVESDDVLLVREITHPNPKWKICGGKVKHGESIIDAAVREGHEETSVDLIPEDIEHVSEERTQDRVYVPHFCIARPPRIIFETFVPVTQENGRPMEVKCFKITNVASLPDFLEPHRRFLPYLLGIPA